MMDDDLFALLVYFLSISVYWIYSYYTLNKEDFHTYRFKINLYRKEWLKKQLGEGRYDNVLNAVRNSLVAASSIVSALIIMLGFILSKLEIPINGKHFTQTNEVLAYLISNKLFLISIMLLFSIYYLIIHIRLLSRVTLLAGIDYSVVKKIEGEAGLDYICSMFNRAMNQFSYAMRFMYFGAVALIWLFNPFVFAIATIIITLILIYRESFAKVEWV